MTPRLSTDTAKLTEKLDRFISQSAFPCLGAKSALQKRQLKIVGAKSIDSGWNDYAIYNELIKFAQGYQRNQKLFQSLAVVFEGPLWLGEASFERFLWERIQSIHEKDRLSDSAYDKAVSPDPSSPHFSLSFGGHAFFAVGLHPRASRKSRRFSHPAIIFNLHDQFERLRADGVYEKLRSTILDRDIAFSGSLNPMLARHGEGSEARQYSGRAVTSEWECPFHAA